jgi:hypothetical protein
MAAHQRVESNFNANARRRIANSHAVSCSAPIGVVAIVSVTQYRIGTTCLFSVLPPFRAITFSGTILITPSHDFRRCSLPRFRFVSVCLVLSLFFAISGCQKASDQSASTDSASNGSSAENSASSSGGSASSNKSGVRGMLSPKPITIPADTTLSVVLDEPIGSKTSSNGQTFSATVSSPIEVNGRVAIPKGAHATGIVRDAKSAGRFKGGAVLTVSLSGVTVNERSYDLQTSDFAQTSKGKGKRSAVMIGGGGAAGALIGGLAGGGKGAAIGAGLTGNREIAWPAETQLTFKLLQPLEIKSK